VPADAELAALKSPSMKGKDAKKAVEKRPEEK